MPPRSNFVNELQQLRDNLLIMASIVYQQLTDAIDALQYGKLAEARRIIEKDAEVNRRRFMLEDAILTLIATQQPMAGDMRFLAGSLEIISELERIGDYAKGNARIALMLGKESGIPMPPELREMCDGALEMLRRAIDAFMRGDVDEARAIPEADDAVDSLYNEVNLQLINMVMANPSSMAYANLYSWAAHNIERTADRATNVCERTVYMVTGEMREIDDGEHAISGLN
jgi:phosphate transport system protein